MLLGPLCGTHQAFFFAIPARKYHRALRLPARFQQLTSSVYGFEHRCRATVGVDRTVDPRIAKLPAPHSANHIPESAELIILLEMHLYPHRPRPHVISERQRTLPFARRVVPAQILKNRRGVVVGERRDWNLRHLRGLLWRNALALRQRRQRCKSRRCRVAGKLEHVSHRSALHAGIGPPGPVWIFVSTPPAVVEGVGIDDHSRCAVFLCDKYLHPAEVLAVAHQHDLAAHIDLHLLQLFEILRCAVVGIYHLCLGIS